MPTKMLFAVHLLLQHDPAQFWGLHLEYLHGYLQDTDKEREKLSCKMCRLSQNCSREAYFFYDDNIAESRKVFIRVES